MIRVPPAGDRRKQIRSRLKGAFSYRVLHCVGRAVIDFFLAVFLRSFKTLLGKRICVPPAVNSPEQLDGGSIGFFGICLPHGVCGAIIYLILAAFLRIFRILPPSPVFSLGGGNCFRCSRVLFSYRVGLSVVHLAGCFVKGGADPFSSIGSGCLRLFQTLFGKKVRVPPAGNGLELPRSLLKRFLCLCRLHGSDRAVVDHVPVALVDMGDIAVQLRFGFDVAIAHGFFEIVTSVKGHRPVGEVAPPVSVKLRHQEADIRVGAFGVAVQHPVKAIPRPVPLAFLQRQPAVSEQHRSVSVVRLTGIRFCDRLLRLFPAEKLMDVADQLLHKAAFFHVVGLKEVQLLGHFDGVHAPAAWQQALGAIPAHQFKEAAPLVFDPNGVEIVGLAADDDHDPRRVERRENIRLLRRASLIRQGDSRVEDAVARPRQLIINLLRVKAVAGALFCFVVRFLAADEHIIRRLVSGDSQNAALYLGYFRRVLPILPLGDAVGILERRQIIRVLRKAVEARAVTGGIEFICMRILDIDNTKAAERTAPVRLGVGFILAHKGLINGERLVKVALTAEVIAAVEPRGSPFVRRLR